MNVTTSPRFHASLLAPRHWLTWVMAAMLWLLAHLPRRVLWSLGHLLGALVQRSNSERRRVARRNIALCFPKRGTAQQRQLLDANMRDLGMLPVEFVHGCFASDKAIERVPVRIEGLEHLQEARRNKQGVLLLNGHFSHMEMSARLLTRSLRARNILTGGMYRRMDWAVIEWLVLRQRSRHGNRMFDKDDLRGTLKFLRSGGVLWYQPDQDMRSKDHVFVPFMGLSTATITATHHLARLGRAQVIPLFCRRLPDGGYALRLEAPLEAFPSDDAHADTARINRVIERMVEEAPEQYLWAHKRFKTRPPGEPDVYGDI